MSVVACTPEGGRGPEVRIDGGSTPTPTRPAEEDALAFGVIGEPSTLDPYAPDASDLTHALVRPLYPSLYRLRPDGEAIPYLAERLERVEGGVVVTLRAARWSDGTDIQAADVIASIERAAEPSGFAAIDAATRLGRRKVRLEGSIRDWERSLATLAYVLPAGTAGEPYGGPLVLARHRPGLELVYTPNPRWVGPSPSIDRVTVRLMGSLEAALGELRSGDLDAASLPATVNLAQRLAATGLESAAALGWERVGMVFRQDVSAGLIDSVSRTIDRELLARSFVRTEGEVDGQLSPSGEAQPLSSTFSVGVPSGDELLELLQRALQVQLEHLGQVDLVQVDEMTFYGPWQSGSPVDAMLVRRTGAPGMPMDGSRVIPLFRMMTSLAWRPGISGMDPNPTIDGPLWNVEGWAITR